MIKQFLSADYCLKCNICTAACPVASATDLFPGPKAIGPQALRFHHPRFPIPDSRTNLCSGCGICSHVCPQGVAVAELNIKTKAQLSANRRIPIGDHIIARPELIGRIVSPIAPIANSVLDFSGIRWMLEKVLSISQATPIPDFSRQPLRKRLREKCVNTPEDTENNSERTVALFHGCSNNYYEPELGELSVIILEALGYKVVLPPQVCCGLPLQSNGMLDAARRYAQTNIDRLHQFAKQGIPIVGTSTSCTLALKHDYRVILDMNDENARNVATSTFDFFEFIVTHLLKELKKISFKPIRKHVLYHPPCQLRGHGIGMPAQRVLRLIPELQISLSEAACCGMAGTYGMKRDKFEVARTVGKELFQQTMSMNIDLVISDSETCRWWITEHTNVPALHPLELMAKAMDLS
jgi:glycerol-3-phosphate dehydrogenase subunit C